MKRPSLFGIIVEVLKSNTSARPVRLVGRPVSPRPKVIDRLKLFQSSVKQKISQNKCPMFCCDLILCALHVYMLYHSINTLKPRRNRQHFGDDIFKCNFFNENIWISMKLSLEFVPMGSVDIIPALVQIMVWRRPVYKPLTKPMMVSLPMHICIIRSQSVKRLFIISIGTEPHRTIIYTLKDILFLYNETCIKRLITQAFHILQGCFIYTMSAMNLYTMLSLGLRPANETRR